MFVKVLSYTREGGSYSKEKYVWVNTDTLWGFNKKGDMYVIYSPLPLGETIIDEQDMNKIKSHLSLDSASKSYSENKNYGNNNNTEKHYSAPLSNKVGVKGRYSILQNHKGEIMVMMDARVGCPENPRFIYDGSDTALLYRSQESSVAFRKIDKIARAELKAVTEVLVVEVLNDEVEREYTVPVRIVKDVNNLIIS